MKNTIIVTIVALVVGLSIGFAVKPASPGNLGGLVHNAKERFVEGLEVGRTGQFSVSNAGVLSSSAAFSLTGGLTVSSGNTSLGTTTAREGFTEGGGVGTVTPTSNAVTLTEAQLLNNNVITFTASTTQAALTVTLPATSTMTTLLANAGDTRRWVIENPFLAAATTTTIAAGTGIDLQEPDGQNVVIGIDNYAFVTCFREASTNVVCSIDETIPAD